MVLDPGPEFARCREIDALHLGSKHQVNLDDLPSVAGIGKPKAENLSIFFSLLNPVLRGAIARLCLDDRDWVVWSIAQDIIRSFSCSSTRHAAYEKNSTVCKCPLLLNSARRIVPARRLQLWNNVLSAGVSFGIHLSLTIDENY